MGFERPAIDPTTDPKKRKFSVAPESSALTEEIALPTLRDSSSASSLRFAAIASASACNRRERSVPGVFPQAPSRAARAASTARSTSASPPIAARASTSPVAGSTTSRTSPDAGSARSPAMNSPCSGATATVAIYLAAAASRLGQAPVRRRLGRLREHLVHPSLHARREAADDCGVVAREHRLEPLPRDLGRVVLVLVLPGLRVEHVRACEEVRRRRPRHERGDGDAAVLDLVADRLGEHEHERLR